MKNTKDLNTNFQAEDEFLTEFCASEMTLGAVGEKNEAGFGKYDDV